MKRDFKKLEEKVRNTTADEIKLAVRNTEKNLKYINDTVEDIKKTLYEVGETLGVDNPNDAGKQLQLIDRLGVLDKKGSAHEVHTMAIGISIGIMETMSILFEEQKGSEGLDEFKKAFKRLSKLLKKELKNIE